MYKSTDAGRTWKNVGLKETRQIARVRVHPTNPDLVYVAAQGHIWGPNAERGIFRSEDGGKTWKKILYVDDKTGASDLAMDPSNPRILYAAFWQVIRQPWELVTGGPGSSLWKSTDGGDSWKKLTEGLPESPWARSAWPCRRRGPTASTRSSRPRHGGLFRSEDGGEKCTHVNDEHKIRERAWYYSWIYPDPKNAEVRLRAERPVHKSIDGGKTFANMPAPHGDNHDIWIDPDDPDALIVGNDGGATITYDGGKSWSTLNNQPTAQFYRVTTDNQFPYWVYGSQQDNSNVAIPSGVAGRLDRPLATGTPPAAARAAGWPWTRRIPNIVYAGEYGGIITRYDHRTKQARVVMAWPQLADGHADEGPEVPLPVERADHDLAQRPEGALPRRRRSCCAAATAARRGRRSRPDLTRNDKAKQGKSGGPDHDRRHGRRGLRDDLRARRVAARAGRDLGRARTTASSTSRATTARRGRT